MSISLTLPFAKNSGSLGYFAFSSTEKEAASYNIKSLVLTNWGERPGHFYLGCNLREFIFGQLADDTTDRIKERIESQLAKWLPYISLNKIDVTMPRELTNGIRIKIEYSLRGRQDMSEIVSIDVVS